MVIRTVLEFSFLFCFSFHNFLTMESNNVSVIQYSHNSYIREEMNFDKNNIGMAMDFYVPFEVMKFDWQLCMVVSSSP